MIPNLEFILKLPVEGIDKLIPGQLVIKEKNYGGGIILKATSGTPGNQYKGAWRLKGRGPLPPSQTIAAQKYTVSTQRLRLDHVPGVEGSFYAIAPFSVFAGNGVQRGDFGIHFDARYPGSAGCIVIQQQNHWDLFRESMAKFREAKFQSVPLLVIYV